MVLLFDFFFGISSDLLGETSNEDDLINQLLFVDGLEQHLIHCFLSLDESEEGQIKERTARQFNNGSDDCIFCES